MQSTACVSVLK